MLRKTRKQLKEEKLLDIEVKKEQTNIGDSLLKSIPSSKILKFSEKKHIEYVYLKIIPDRTIELEQKTYFLAKTLYSILQMRLRAIVNNKDGSSYRNNRLENIKISYIIDLSNKVNFYFLCPLEIKDILTEKIYEVFKNAVVREVDDFELPKMDVKINKKGKEKEQHNVICNEIKLKYNDALSLNTDNSLYNLEEMINNHHWLKDDDRITIMFNFTKSSDKDFLACKQECMRRIGLEEPRYNLLNNKINSEFILNTTMGVTANILEASLDTLTGILGAGMNNKIQSRVSRK